MLSAGLVFMGLWIRNGIGETPSFREAKEKGEIVRLPIAETLRNQWREVLIAAGAKVVETAPFYIFSTFVVSYATGTLHFDRFTVLNAITLSMVLTTLAIPLMGALSDRLGYKRVYLTGAVLMAVFAYPYFMLLDLRTELGLLLASGIGLVLFWSPVTAVLGTLCSTIFAARVRYTGVSLGYQLGSAIAGGTAPLIATWLLKEYHNAWQPVALYLVFTSLISIVSVLFSRPHAAARQPEKGLTLQTERH